MKYDDVSFTFSSPLEGTMSYVGTVIVRLEGLEMVLDIPWDDGHYVVTGQRRPDGWFIGTHYREGALDDVEVFARWQKIGTEYSGTWTEEGHDYDLRFSLKAD